MAAKRKRPANEWQVRAVKAESENRRLVQKLKGVEADRDDLRSQLAFLNNLTPAQRSVVAGYLDSLDTLALLTSANRAIRTDTVKVSGSKTTTAPDVTPVYAHNLLEHHIDHLYQCKKQIDSWANRPGQVDTKRTTCRRCRYELDLSVRDLTYCPNCGLDRSHPKQDTPAGR